MDLFRVAVVQAGSVPFDRERSTMKALNLTGQAIRSGARLIVFPEAFISGYPKGIDFGARVGMRSSEGRKWFRTYFESAIMVPRVTRQIRVILYAKGDLHGAPQIKPVDHRNPRRAALSSGQRTPGAPFLPSRCHSPRRGEPISEIAA